MVQSLDLASLSPTWTINEASVRPIHNGDVCTLGLFCIAGEPLGSDRDLLDFIDIAVDAGGLAHIAYTDDAFDNGVLVANQVTGSPPNG
ncbi:MAG: hypothetical protein ABR507_04550 [Actinomycetota bacterium]|nr:hypothetical protein [Actinomycetota bacterium]